MLHRGGIECIDEFIQFAIEDEDELTSLMNPSAYLEFLDKLAAEGGH